MTEQHSPLYLQSDRLTLRPFSLNDAANLLDLDSDPQVMKYLTNGRASTPAEISATLERIFKYYEKFGGRFGVWAAIEKSTDTFTGWFLLRPDKKDPENTQDLELGYRLKAEFWGKGFATEMSRQLLAKAFNELGAKTVFAQTMQENKASANVMKKLGMKFEKTFIEQEFPVPNQPGVLYRITRQEYETQN